MARTVAGLIAVTMLIQCHAGLEKKRPSPFKWSWDRLETFTYGTNTSCCPFNGTNAHCCSGIDSPEEIQWKLRYGLVLIDNELSSPGCRNAKTDLVNWTKCNDFKAARAADIKRADPSKPTFVYRGGPFGCFGIDDQSVANPDEPWFNYLTNETLTLKDTWLSDRSQHLLPGVCDFRKRAAQDYWLTQQVFGSDRRWLLDEKVDGFFSDSGLIMGWGGDKHNITVGTRNELFNATAVTMRRMAATLQEHHKILTFSLKDHFSSIRRTGGGTSGGTLCDPNLDPSTPVAGLNCFPYGEDVLFEIMGDVLWMPFREYNIPSRDFGKDNVTAQWDGCAAAIENHAIEARQLPVMSCNNDGSFNTTVIPTQFGNLTWLEQHQVSLAAHMLGMEEGSYFGSGMHWSDEGWHVWWPEYDRPLGKPHGPYKRSGYKFKRSFQHVDVYLDCQKLQAKFNWHGKGSMHYV